MRRPLVAVAFLLVTLVGAESPTLACPEPRVNYTVQMGPARPVLYAIDVRSGAEIVVREPSTLRALAFSRRVVAPRDGVVRLEIRDDGNVEVLVDGVLQVRYFTTPRTAFLYRAELTPVDAGAGWLKLSLTSDAVALRWERRLASGRIVRRWYTQAGLSPDLRLSCMDDEPGIVEVTALFADGAHRLVGAYATPLTPALRPLTNKGTWWVGLRFAPLGYLQWGIRDAPMGVSAPQGLAGQASSGLPVRVALGLLIAVFTLLLSCLLAGRLGSRRRGV